MAPTAPGVDIWRRCLVKWTSEPRLVRSVATAVAATASIATASAAVAPGIEAAAPAVAMAVPVVVPVARPVAVPVPAVDGRRARPARTTHAVAAARAPAA